MADLLALILPIFLLVGVGYLAVRTRFVPEQLVQALGAFVLNFALPAVILNALLKQDLRQTLSWNYLAAYAGGSLIAFGAILLVMRLWRKPLPHAAIAALGASAANSGFVGFPVASLAIGAPALTALPLTMLVENILIIPLALTLAEIGSQRGEGTANVLAGAVRRLARTPLILAIIVGAVLSGLGLHLPGPVATALGMMASASVPTALFVVGGTLAGLRAGAVAGELSAIVAGKLILHPLAVTGALLLLGGVAPGVAAAGIVLAASPMLTIYPILGARFGYDRACAAALLVATTLSFATLSVVLAYVLPHAGL